MKKLGDFARERRQAIARSWRRLLRSALSAHDHLVLLRHDLHENREAEAELRDALLARVVTVEQQLPNGQQALMNEWDTIERQLSSPTSRRLALRNLFNTVAVRASERAHVAETSADSADDAVAIKIKISPGELIDRITILENKLTLIHDESELKTIRVDYEIAQTLLAKLPTRPEVEALRQELSAVNRTLWQLDKDMRDHEQRLDFTSGFIDLACSIRHNNDRRIELTRRINLALAVAPNLSDSVSPALEARSTSR